MSPDDCVAIINATLKDRDWPGMECALNLLAVKDPTRAQEMYDTLKLGLELASMTPDQRAQAGREAISLGLTIAEERT